MHSLSHLLNSSTPEFLFDSFFIVSIPLVKFSFVHYFNFIPELIQCIYELSCILLQFFITAILNSLPFTSPSFMSSSLVCGDFFNLGRCYLVTLVVPGT